MSHPDALIPFRESFPDLTDAEIAEMAKVSIEETVAYRAFLEAEQVAVPEAVDAVAPTEEPKKPRGRAAKPKAEPAPAPRKPTAEQTATPEATPDRVRVTVRRLLIHFSGPPQVIRRYDEFGGELAAWLWVNHRSAVEAV